MAEAPNVLITATSSLAKRLQGMSWEGLSCGVLSLEQLLASRERAHVLVLSSEEARDEWNRVEEFAIDSPLHPLIIGRRTRESEESSALLGLAPVLEDPDDAAIQDAIRRLLKRSAWLHRELVSVDDSAELLIQNAQCEWDRCSVGIVGLITLSGESALVNLRHELGVLRSNAYATIDRVPAARLSTDDLWTLLLVVRVPWTREELAVRDGESSVLREFVSDTIGSRKLVMCTDESVRSLLGPIVGDGSAWYPTSDDPLRDQVRTSAKNPEELKALDLLFTKRFSDEEFERFIAMLGKRS